MRYRQLLTLTAITVFMLQLLPNNSLAQNTLTYSEKSTHFRNGLELFKKEIIRLQGKSLSITLSPTKAFWRLTITIP